MAPVSPSGSWRFNYPERSSRHPSGKPLTTLRKKDITDLLAMLLATPVLAVWALLSFLPFFQLFERGSSTGDIVVQGVFLVTGALGIIALWGGLRLLMRSDVRVSLRGEGNSTTLKLAIYAAAWLISYITYSVS